MRIEEVMELQKADETLSKYWKLTDDFQGDDHAKPYRGNPTFIKKKGLLYRDTKRE